MQRVLILFLLSIFFASCEKIKGVEGKEDTAGPNITVIKPQAEYFAPGDTLRITALFQDNDALHDIYIGLNDMTIGLKRIHWSLHQHGASARVDTFYVFPSDLKASEFVLQIESSDHSNNRCSLRKTIFVN